MSASGGLRARASAPATVANVGPGFDVLGLCLEGPRDTVEAELTSSGHVEIASIQGDDGRLPLSAADNCIGVVAQEVLSAHGQPGQGVRLRLDKGLPLGTGMGSSAASSVAAALATAAVLDAHHDRRALLDACRLGEALASGSPHADNVAPSLLGGIVACLPGESGELDVISLPIPQDLWVVVVRPDLQVNTQEARDILPERVPLLDAVAQTGRLVGLVASLYEGDLETLGRSLTDGLVTPYRKQLVPGFDPVCQAAMKAGALGCGLSGSGPSIFAFVAGGDAAPSVAVAMERAFGLLGTAAWSVHGQVCAGGASVEIL